MSPTIRHIPAVPGFPLRTRTRTIRACWIPAQASWARYWCPKSAWNCRFGMVRPNRCSPSVPGICTAPACRSAALARPTWAPYCDTGSHTVVTGHRGLVKSLMFTRLDELHDGDFMYIKVMDETLGYEVDRISVIEPDDVSRLKIVPGEDRLTLMTCTPYGINTHRLLVSGHRVAIPLPAPDPADVRDERATELGALAMTIVCTMGGMLLCCMVVRSMRPRHRIMRHASAWPRKG